MSEPKKLIIERHIDADPLYVKAATAMHHEYVILPTRMPSGTRIEYRLFVRYDPEHGPIVQGYGEVYTGYRKHTPYHYVNYSEWWVESITEYTTVIGPDEVRERIPLELVEKIEKHYAKVMKVKHE